MRDDTKRYRGPVRMGTKGEDWLYRSASQSAPPLFLPSSIRKPLKTGRLASCENPRVRKLIKTKELVDFCVALRRSMALSRPKLRQNALSLNSNSIAMSVKTEFGCTRSATKWAGSFQVAVGMSDMPVPGCFEDFFKASVLGRPTQFASNSFRTGYQDGRIAGAARRVQERNVAAGDTRCRGDDFANAEAGAVAKIVDMTIGSIERLKDGEVSGGEIVDMDEVADASSIW